MVFLVDTEEGERQSGSYIGMDLSGKVTVSLDKFSSRDKDLGK